MRIKFIGLPILVASLSASAAFDLEKNYYPTSQQGPLRGDQVKEKFLKNPDSDLFKNASEQLKDSANRMMKEFTADPVAFMNKKLNHFSDSRSMSKFDEAYVNQTGKKFVEDKHKWRTEKICSGLKCKQAMNEPAEEGRAPSLGNDQAVDLVDNPDTMLNSLSEIDKLGLHQKRLTKENFPWSDNYWPLYQGVLGSRYASGMLDMGEHWQNYFEVITDPLQTLTDIWNSREASAIDRLSPSEKYDLMIGLNRYNERDRSVWQTLGSRVGGWYEDRMPAGFLTPHQWLQGQGYYNDRGEVEPWMGICHGWAAAAYIIDRPVSYVDVPAADDPSVNVRFYPADIKALTSYLFAETRTETKFVGGRCNTKDPRTDEASGRVLSQDCFDTNPHTWHAATVNQLSVNNRSFILDATYDYEVWNQPVVGYNYVYFDLIPNNHGDYNTSYDWKDVARNRTDKWFAEADTFKKFRVKEDWSGRKDTEYYDKVVGVVMEVEYLVETHPSQYTRDHAGTESDGGRDATKTVRYVYDLEVKADGTMVGGEWYSNLHPDFLWNIPTSVTANKEYHSKQDSAISSTWNMNQPLPDEWRQWARSAAVSDKVPLGKIVDALISKSRGE